MQILDVLKNQYIVLIGLGIFKIKNATKNPKFYQKKRSLKKQSKLTKRYHSSPSDSKKGALDIQTKECTSVFIESKEI